VRIVLQRVTEASVKIDNEVKGQIDHGFLILVGIENEDEKSDADWLIQKINGLRVFADQEGKMNLSIQDVKGSILLISQFTLFASTKKGNRPSYIQAARTEIAIPLYAYFTEQLKIQTQLKVETGVFGADMKVSLINDGPVTISIDSKNRE
jgi:D-tyrosyl-tRNA(Tyr) deacylase